jgi:hypothetical protein
VAKYIYGIVEETAPEPAGSGIAGGRLGLISGRGASALVSEVSDDELAAGREEVLIHSRVLEEAMAKSTVLPMRFGVVMDGPAEVRERLLEPHAAELRAHLDRLDGKVEVNIRVVYEQDVLMAEVVREDREIARLRDSLRGQPEDATYYGRIRLGELVAAAVERKRESDAADLIDQLVTHALEYTVAEPAHERIVLTASFLVERTRLDKFDAAVDRAAEGQAGRMRFKYTGPLPPHSFVELAGTE